MTRDEYEAAARDTAEEARRTIRKNFQFAHPHYTPPTWGDEDDWSRWLSRNLLMHGVDGFVERGLYELAPAYLRCPRP